MGWTLDRWRDSTFTEFNLSVKGYWRNWERCYGVPMRQVCYFMVMGNPYIKQHDKPHSPEELMRFSIDEEKERPQPPTEEEIKKIKEDAKKLWETDLKRS